MHGEALIKATFGSKQNGKILSCCKKKKKLNWELFCNILLTEKPNFRGFLPTFSLQKYFCYKVCVICNSILKKYFEVSCSEFFILFGNYFVF